MSRFAEKLREAFRLVPGDPEKLLRDDAMQMKELVYDALTQRDLVEPEDMWIASDIMGAVIAAGFARLRRDDDDWKKLDRWTAWRLYVSVALQFLIMLYGKNSIPKRKARKHEAEK